MNKSTGLLLLSGSDASAMDIKYLSKFTAPDQFMYLQTEAQGVLVVSSMEQNRAKQQSTPGTVVYTPAELGLKGKDLGDAAAWALALITELKLTQIEVPPDFPVGLFKKIEAAGHRLEIKEGALCPQRKVKTAAEIKCLEESQAAAVDAMGEAIRLIEQSEINEDNQLVVAGELLTSERVREAIHKKLIEHGCIGIETIVAGGIQGTDPHDRGAGPLYGGQSIVIDIFPKSEKHGYWGDMTRTVARGPVSSELKKLYEAVKEAQQAALDCVAPGVCADNVHSAAQAIFEKRGYKTTIEKGRHVGFIHGTGHGVGLDIHEFPRVGRSGEILEAGHCITIEPGLYYPDLGGVRIEDTIIVTEDGWRYLAPFEKRFEV